MTSNIRQGSLLGERTLQRLYAMQEFSLARYGDQTNLYVGGRHACLAVLRDIAQQQAALAAEIGELLANRRVFLQSHGFPLCFSRLNDLCVAYVAWQVLVEQPDLIAAISECMETLQGDEEAYALARRTHHAEVENLRRLKQVLGVRFEGDAAIAA